ncbi:MAG: DUF2070 family protein [Zestosphaera sp.]
MSIEWITRKYYGRLNILPRRRFLLLIYIGLIVATGLLNTAEYTLDNVFRSIATYFVLGSVLTLIYLPLMFTRLFNTKRVLGLSLVTFATSLVAELLFYRLIGLRGLGPVVASGFVMIILSVFTSMYQAIAVSTLTPILTFTLVNTFLLNQQLNYTHLISATLIELASISLGILFIYYIDSRGRRLSGISPIVALRAFLNTWFTGDSGSLELLFDGIGTAESVEIKSIVFKRVKEPHVVMVFPRIHFGPFDEVGSSSFIHYLDRELEPEFKVLTFHTPGSHEHNLASSKDAVRVAHDVAENIRNSINDEGGKFLCPPYRVKLSDGWEAFTLSSKDFLATIVVNKTHGNDDIPYQVWDLLNTDDRSPTTTMVVDAHSCKGNKVLDPGILKPLLDKVLNSYECGGLSDFHVGYGESRASTTCVELCDTRVKTLTINVGGRRYGLIYIYGNNVDKEFRTRLDKILGSLTYLNDFEVITPDDHSCAASMSESPYEVVKECHGLVEAIVDSVRKASISEVPATYRVVNFRSESIKIVGNRVFTLMESLNVLAGTTERGLIVLALLFNLLLPLLYTALTL